MSFEAAPIWLVFLGTVVLVLICLRIGLLVGRRRQRLADGKLEGPAPSSVRRWDSSPSCWRSRSTPPRTATDARKPGHRGDQRHRDDLAARRLPRRPESRRTPASFTTSRPEARGTTRWRGPRASSAQCGGCCRRDGATGFRLDHHRSLHSVAERGDRRSPETPDHGRPQSRCPDDLGDALPAARGRHDHDGDPARPDPSRHFGLEARAGRNLRTVDGADRPLDRPQEGLVRVSQRRWWICKQSCKYSLRAAPASPTRRTGRRRGERSATSSFQNEVVQRTIHSVVLELDVVLLFIESDRAVGITPSPLPAWSKMHHEQRERIVDRARLVGQTRGSDRSRRDDDDAPAAIPRESSSHIADSMPSRIMLFGSGPM